MEKQAQSNFPYLKVPRAPWSARGRIPDLAPFPKAHPAMSPANLSYQAEAGLAVLDGSQGAGKHRAAGAEHGASWPRHSQPPTRAGGLRPQLMIGRFCKKEKRAHH